VSSKPTARRTGAAVAALAAVALSSGCSLLPLAGHAAGQASGTAPAASLESSAAASDAPGEVAGPAVGKPVTPGDLGSIPYDAHGPTTMTLTGVHRVSDELGLVSFTLAAPAQGDGAGPLYDFADDSLRHSHTEVDELAKDANVSDVTVTAPGDPTVYQVATDGADHCLCSRVPIHLQAGDPATGWAYVSLPPTAATVDVTIGPVGPWTGVPVS